MNASNQVLKIALGAAISLAINALLMLGCLTAVLVH